MRRSTTSSSSSPTSSQSSESSQKSTASSNLESIKRLRIRKMALITKHLRQSYVIAIGLVVVITCLLSAGFIEIYLRCFVKEPEIALSSAGRVNIPIPLTSTGSNTNTNPLTKTNPNEASQITPNPNNSSNKTNSHTNNNKTPIPMEPPKLENPEPVTLTDNQPLKPQADENTQRIPDTTETNTDNNVIISNNNNNRDHDDHSAPTIEKEPVNDPAEDKGTMQVVISDTEEESSSFLEENSVDVSKPFVEETGILVEDFPLKRDISDDVTDVDSIAEAEDLTSSLAYSDAPVAISTLDEATARAFALEARYIALSDKVEDQDATIIIDLLKKAVKANPFLGTFGNFDAERSNNLHVVVNAWNRACQEARLNSGQTAFLRYSIDMPFKGNYEWLDLPRPNSNILDTFDGLPLINQHLLSVTYSESDQKVALDNIKNCIRILEEKIIPFPLIDSILGDKIPEGDLKLLPEIKDKLAVAINYYNQLVLEADSDMYDSLAATLGVQKKSQNLAV